MQLMRRTASPKRTKRDAKEAADAPRADLPAFIEPCLATLIDKAPGSGNWIHEIKFDGYRLQARLERGKVKLLTRKGLDWTTKFSTIADAIAKLPATAALIDGELVSEGNDGISSFSLLQQDLKDGRHDRMVFYAFDLLHLGDADLQGLPLRARKAALAKLLARTSKRGPLRLSESLTEPGPVLLDHACRMGLEGIVSKLADAAYHSGRGRDWLKTKCSDRQEFVVLGFVPSTADARAVGALVLGFYEGGTLRYAGRSGTGFTHDVARSLFRRLHPTTVKTPPLRPVPKEERGRRGATWVEPRMVVEVDFHGWTHGGRIRQASFQGLREDKPAKEVVREVKKNVTAAAATGISAKRVSARSAPPHAGAPIGRVKLTHPERVYWDDAGITKRDLADYYGKVWKWMAPHVTGRAIALVRCPEGADMGQCFFQKHARAGIPTEFLHLVPEKGDEIISIDDLDGLIALVQGGALEIHVRGSRIDDRERADRLVFDLDPGPGTGWADVVAAAREVRARLKQIKLESFLKTSGGKGLHVVVPIAPEPWETVKRFTKIVAESMARDEPDRYLATATKAKRNNRIFVDYLRNSREATAIAPYSTRARPGASVSAPVAWSELGSLKSASQYTVQNVVQRLSRLKSDPWAAMGKVKQALPSFK
jgi:bifunctional non-homologous end joining protein LigD